MVNVGFLRAASPLVLAHVVVPPLSVVRGEGVQWLLSYDAQTRFESSMKSLMLDTNAPMHSPTRVTSMFVHADYNHMFNNICSLLLHGLPVYETFGFMGLFFVFLVGGVIASLPSFLRDSQIKEVARSVTSATTFKVGPEKSLFNPLAGAWNRHGATFCGMVAAKMFATQPSCGSSGGVSALIGCCLFLLLRDAANIVCRSMCAKSTAVSPLCLAASTLPWHVFGLHFLGYVLKKLSDVYVTILPNLAS